LTVDIEPLVSWAEERMAIFLRKGAILGTVPRCFGGMDDAWGGGGYEREPHRWSLRRLTDDPILSNYRFCNVFRELDAVTIWIRKNIREPFADHPHLWFMLAAARTINWPPTLQRLMETKGAWPSDPGFSPRTMTAVLEQYKAEGNKVETGAYMIRAESDRNAPWYSWTKQRYVSEVVLGKLWEHRSMTGTFLSPGASPVYLQDVWNYLQDYTGWGPFMAYQVVVDMRWTRYLQNAPDIQTWAALGPGSRRGLNRLHGRDPKAPLSQERGLDEMLEVRELMSRPGLLAPWLVVPDLSDVQNCLCETDKYLRVTNGEGRPRSKYVPGRGS
jgi:hypothetical protein